MIKTILFLTRLHCCPEVSKDQLLLQFTQTLSATKWKGTLVLSVRYSAIFAVAFLFTVFSSCNSGSSSAFGEILSQPPFASLTDSIKHDSKNDDLYFRRAVLLNKNNFPEPALADFQKAWSLHKNEKYAFAIANIWKERKTDSAVIFLNEALEVLPESYLLRITLARCYDALDKTKEALKVCDYLLMMRPGLTEVLLLQSELFEKKGDVQGSIAPLEKAYRLAPANLEIGFKLAYKYAQSKDARVLALCDSMIRKDPQHLHADPYYVKGVYYSNINDKAKAIQWFDETVRHDYNYLNAYIEKGKILVEQKKTAQAFKVFQLVNTIKPAFPDAYYWMGVCQQALGQKSEAKLSYEKAYSLDKTLAEAKEAADKLGK